MTITVDRARTTSAPDSIEEEPRASERDHVTRPHDPFRDVYLAMDNPGDYRTEYLRGQIVMMSSASTIHNRILMLIGQQAPEGVLAYATQGIEFSTISDLPEPDVVFAEDGAITGNPNYIPAELTLAVVEIVSPSNWRTDVLEKAELYAEGRVGTYVLVDPRDGTITVYSRPNGKVYQDRSRYQFGEPVPMPYGADLDTSRFPTYPPR
ncbi:Uma2 family endonuclease [Yinghuangia soli]|uniref:Uma2 family endonuclease n=1 Tax=Yinghuangia soli TaxID=2908204 RepID=A0AA41Q7K6_9ACTN|nr:Uma2 family endonuclease [Yinghuangia soli]MCF2532691.1 Uma2 family endonuclease [Yinghuangia soli]